MKIRMIAVFVSTLVLAAAACAVDNSCAYTFTYPKSQFSFCVTIYGTLASIQSPIGVNHLDPLNPVEGWTGFITDDGGGTDGFTVVPAFGIVDSRPVVRQPRGAGTLPLIFDFGGRGFFVERINADPDSRDISIALTIHSCHGCFWQGPISKVANIRPDGNSIGNFAHSSFSSFGYARHGVMLTIPETAICAGADPNGASVNPYIDCSISNAPFMGLGAIFGSWSFMSPSGKPMTMKAVYHVF